MTAILVTGGEGQVGFELQRFAWPAGVEIVAPARDELDIRDPAAIDRLLAGGGIAAVINAAAYTAVDKAESEIAAAFAANALGPATLAQATREAGIPLVHVSTDYVFDGTKRTPYEVDDPIGPLNVYGASKAAGELAVLRGNPRSAIVRTGWVVSARRTNFVRTMLRLGAERDVIRVVHDQTGAPTIASDLAAALATVALRMAHDSAAPTGLFHFSNSGPTTWRDFAAAIFESAARRALKTPKIEAIATADYPTPARRPANGLLSTLRIAREYGVQAPPWRDRLPALVDEIRG